MTPGSSGPPPGSGRRADRTGPAAGPPWTGERKGAGGPSRPGADPNAPDSRADSPWLVTGVTGSVRMMRLLLPAGPDLKQPNRLGWTALLEAVILGDGGPRHEEVVALLLAAGADPARGDHDGTTPYEHAVRRGFDGMARLVRAAEEERGTGR
ncbi:ankyrin repeat domain-containing protein [Streptomyces sp. NPDC058611]|uniref:ankyrin repeat domain-containing protein n=1 Tax=unclassified Streptomyces TaxID=2593676 RepID=UPI00365DBF82